MFDRYQNALRSVYNKRIVRADSSNVRRCPHCDEDINASAEHCWQCGEILNDVPDKPSATAITSPSNAGPPLPSDTGLSDENTQGDIHVASVGAETVRVRNLPRSVKFGAAIFLIGLIGYFVSANKIKTDPFTYDFGQITSQFNWALFFAQYGIAVSVLGIGIAVFGFILSVHNLSVHNLSVHNKE